MPGRQHDPRGGPEIRGFRPESGTVAGMATRTSSAPRGNPAVNQAALRPGAPARLRPNPQARAEPQAPRAPAQLAAVEPRQPWLVRVAGRRLAGRCPRRRGGYPPDRLRRQRPRPRGPPRRRSPVQPRARRLRRHLRLVGLPGWFPDMVYGIVNGTFGWMALLLPLMLFVCAFRLFRQPVDGRGNNRIGIGFLVMTFAGSGLAHVIGGDRPSPTGSTGCAGRRHARLPCRRPAGRHPLRRPAGRLRPARLHLAADRHRHAVRRHPRPAARRLRTPHGHRPAGPRTTDGDGHDRSYLYENDTPAPAKKKRRRLFGKDPDDEAGLEGYVGDEAFERALIADEEAEAARAAGGAKSGSKPAPIRRARRAPPHPGRDRRREDQGRPGARDRRRRAAGENATEAIPLVTPGWSPPGR